LSEIPIPGIRDQFSSDTQYCKNGLAIDMCPSVGSKLKFTEIKIENFESMYHCSHQNEETGYQKDE
jgi:hypothetical protein